MALHCCPERKGEKWDFPRFFIAEFFDQERGEQRKAERSKSGTERQASSVRHSAYSARR